MGSSRGAGGSVPKIYTPSPAALEQMLARNPLAILVSAGPDGLMATPLPLFMESGDGEGHLIGHFARSNRQVEALKDDPQALVVFLGPHGYVSPSWLDDRSQAPTWNYNLAQFHVTVSFDPSEAAARAAVEALVDRMETGRPGSWSATEMGERYQRLLPGIIAFRAEISRSMAKFKLGQNEREDVLIDILAGLERERQSELRDAMVTANAGRLGLAGIEPEVCVS